MSVIEEKSRVRLLAALDTSIDAFTSNPQFIPPFIIFLSHSPTLLAPSIPLFNASRTFNVQFLSLGRTIDAINPVGNRGRIELFPSDYMNVKWNGLISLLFHNKIESLVVFQLEVFIIPFIQ